MTALADFSALINRLTGGNSGTPEHIPFWKDSRVAGAASVNAVVGRWTSLWQFDGHPGPGTNPTAAAIPDNTTAGGLQQTDPGGGRQKWILGIEGSGAQIGTLLLYDRLAHAAQTTAPAALSGTVTTAQVTSITPTRYTTTESPGNMIAVEISGAIGGTATTATIEYTNQAGTTAKVTPAFAIGGAGLQEAQRWMPISLAAGDTGVRSITNIDLLASTATAGTMNLVVYRPICILPITSSGTGAMRDMVSGLPSITEIKTDACLSFAWFAGSTTMATWFGSTHFVES